MQSPLRYRFNSLLHTVLLLLLCVAGTSSAQTAPNFGQAGSFGVIGGSAVTNTGPTIVFGDLGVSPGTAVSGFPPGIVNGVLHNADAVAMQAQADVVIAYDSLANQPFNTDLTGQDLGGLSLTPGVYRFSTSAQLTGTLTFDAQGDPNAVFIVQIGSTLTTASNAVVRVINGGSGCNVFWQVGSSATLGTGTAFIGHIVALSSITLNTGANTAGRLLARNGAVTLDSNVVAACTSAGGGCPTLALEPAALADAQIGLPYSQALLASGGAAPYIYTLVADSLPSGMTLSPAGLISGTPLALGSSAFTVRATDANGCLITRRYTIVVGANTIGQAPRTVPTLPASGLLLLIAAFGLTGLLTLRR
ncbi:MAG: ice-binding family protein [Aquimonas sp.]|nr:ice-binding family protein [Aquimonas sp.]